MTRAGHARGIAGLLLLLGGLSSARAGGEPLARTPDFDAAAFDRILGGVVRDEAVDYPLLRRRFLAPLDDFLGRASRFDAASVQRDEALAFYINLYNATMLRAVAERFEPGYSVSQNGFELFDEPLMRLAGGPISLNQLEHELIRKRFHEPRIHVALVCAARSCPPLLPRAYRADDLDDLLEANMRRFVNDPSRNRIDLTGRTLWLSKIFEWYAEDFGGTDRLASYVDRYTDADVSGFSVSFTDYSWELNLAPASD